PSAAPPTRITRVETKSPATGSWTSSAAASGPGARWTTFAGRRSTRRWISSAIAVTAPCSAHSTSKRRVNRGSRITVYVVRHAKAGDRDAWEGDDRQRPLTKSGWRQADALAESLQKEPIDKILSSHFVRSVQTVAPLARTRNLAVEPTPDLQEGAGAERTL